jgi:hypothetical protein
MCVLLMLTAQLFMGGEYLYEVKAIDGFSPTLASYLDMNKITDELSEANYLYLHCAVFGARCQ